MWTSFEVSPISYPTETLNNSFIELGTKDPKDDGILEGFYSLRLASDPSSGASFARNLNAWLVPGASIDLWIDSLATCNYAYLTIFSQVQIMLSGTHKF